MPGNEAMSYKNAELFKRLLRMLQHVYTSKAPYNNGFCTPSRPSMFIFPVFISRKKIRTTSAYIFETLFKKGVNSDVTISALGKLFFCISDYQSNLIRRQG